MSELEHGVQLDGRLELPLGFVEALRLQRVLAGAQMLHRTLPIRAPGPEPRGANTSAPNSIAKGTGDRIG